MREGGGRGRGGIEERSQGEGNRGRLRDGEGGLGKRKGRKTRQGRRLGKGRYTNVPSAINADDFSHHQT